jgi:uncharacterized protein YcfL
MKKWILVILGLLTLVGAIFGITNLINKDDELKVINPTFSLGSLNQGGQWVESKSSIYTKDMFASQGLEVTLDFEHNIEYEIYFYDEDGRFIEKTGLMSDTYVNDNLSRMYARIVITPKWELIDTETTEIKWYEISKYSSQLNIKVNKEQNELLTLSIVCDFTDEESMTISFVDGMTWEEFVDSYFDDDFTFEVKSDGTIVVDGLATLYDKDGVKVISNEAIDVNSYYEFK